jgi:hypothetical protein
MKTSQKLAELVQRELPQLLNQIIIDDGGKYRAYGIYVIESSSHGYTVTRRDHAIGTFSSSKSALAWCIADRNNQLNLAREIQNLDFTLVRLRNDIQIRGSIAKTSRGQLWETAHVKTAQRYEHSRHIENELTKCINSAKYQQLRGFNNETARTGG